MTLEDISIFAELVGSAAIVISLVFVVYEIRLNRRQAELTNWREVLQDLSNYKGITNDLKFSAFLMRAHEDYETLTPAEKMSFGHYMEQGIHIYTNFFKHNEALPTKIDGVDEAIANSLREMLDTPGGRAWWAENQMRGRLLEETYQSVNGLIETVSK